jgi:hypothetical protein
VLVTGPKRHLGQEPNPIAELFQVPIGASHRLDDGSQIGFRALLGDSRCPINADCSSPGSATIRLWVLEAGGDSALATVTIPGGVVHVRKYAIQLLRLDPYPGTDPAGIEPSVAHLSVNRLNVGWRSLL